METKSILIIFAFACLSFSCGQQKIDTAAEETALRNADISWSKVGESKNVDAFAQYFIEDAVLLPPNEPMTSGKEAIKKKLAEFFAMPGFSVKFGPTKAAVAGSGDFGYTIGTYEMTVNDDKGNPVTDKGKYTTVWKKQADGSWKVASDMFNSDLPMQQP
jgi:uncharacterized protein (TIGR02246 family)